MESLSRTLKSWENAINNYPDKTTLTIRNVNKLRNMISKIMILETRIELIKNEAREYINEDKG